MTVTGGVTGKHALWVDNKHQVVLPEKFTELRSHQESAIMEILEHLWSGVPVVMLDAPTGAGKTIIGECVRQIYARSQGWRTLYVCTTKTLQDQFVHDFPDGALIKGRANYPTLDDDRITTDACYRERNLSDRAMCEGCGPGRDDASDATKPRYPLIHCRWCHPVWDCPYSSAKQTALESDLAVANTAYALAEANYAGLFGQHVSKDGYVSWPFPFWVIDEADTLESVLMGHIEFGISERAMSKMRANPPELVTKAESWMKWCKHEAEPKIRSQLSKIDPKDDPKGFREWASMLGGVKRVAKLLEEQPENWVLASRGKGVSLKPVTVKDLAYDQLWRHSRQALLMSATLISDAQVADDLGIEFWRTVRVDSLFPPERRRVIVRTRASMSHKTKDESYPKMAEAIREIIQHYREGSEFPPRMLVHTVSYDLTAYLKERLSDLWGVLAYSSAKEREGVLSEFRALPGAVLLAPSLDRGVDLPDDDVRVIIIAKVPFPHLGDKQIQARFYGTGAKGRTWYATETVRSIVQMTGRGMRHRDDWVVSFILDSQFRTNVWKNHQYLLPEWWVRAVEWQL
jgi:ATP-dependent DNA helicase DinG